MKEFVNIRTVNKWLVLLLMTLFCTSCSNREGYVQYEYYPNGEIKAQTEILNGEWHGKRVRFYPSGKVETISYFKDGLNEGEMIDYYEHGQVAGRIMYKNNLLQGPAKYYYPNGKLEVEAQYKNDIAVGWVKFYREDGSLTAMDHHVVNLYEPNGRKELSQVIKFDELGRIMKDSSYYVSVSSNCNEVRLNDTCFLTVTLEKPKLKQSMQLLIGGYDEFFKLVDPSQQDTIKGKNFKATYRFVAKEKGLNVIRGRVDDFEQEYFKNTDTVAVRRERRLCFSKTIIVR
ncbi:toxin-antitoxin system YwqK family antitoxin [Rufibacter sp. DG15C]|uniref:toxin-antitoxin system YwqK family antitoxin n=1 Tax=Rufibacter sp. DG15C TaxID=1379909 RepID=UPI00083752D6|nr:toxin-antitoxin system YwqK family antitoxin [Rufibacter sp. DG15C]